MEKETILAKISAKIEFSQETISWADRLLDKETARWLLGERHNQFFARYRSDWEEALVESCEPIVQRYFRKIGLADEDLPRVRAIESYAGSWIIDAVIVFRGTATKAYEILRSVSEKEFSDIAEDISKLKDVMKSAFAKTANTIAIQKLKSIGTRQNRQRPGVLIPLQTDFVLDPRPLLSLSAAKMIHHKIHLGVAISRESLTLENLSDEIMRDMKIGLFKSPSPRSEWSFEDAYSSRVGILSPNQTMSKDCQEFKNSEGLGLDFSDNVPLYVDCWIQDMSGIYIFNFRLDA